MGSVEDQTPLLSPAGSGTKAKATHTLDRLDDRQGKTEESKTLATAKATTCRVAALLQHSVAALGKAQIRKHRIWANKHAD